MLQDLKSFFLISSSALLFLLLSGVFFIYEHFRIEERLSVDEQSQLLFIGLGMLFMLLLVFFLFAKRFLFPILALKEEILSKKEEKEAEELLDYDEISLINDHLLSLQKALEEDSDALQNLSLTDTLTGINNRRYFFEFGEKLFKLSKRNKEPLSLIIFDIDNLKAINIKYGNSTGDNVLSLLTEVTEEYIRKSDVFARYGGEEFVLLLPKTNLEDAVIVAQKIQNALETPDFKHKADTYFTISIGIASIKEDDILLRDITHRADLALATAKKKGRNCIEFN